MYFFVVVIVAFTMWDKSPNVLLFIFDGFSYLLKQLSTYLTLYLLILIFLFFEDLILLSVVSAEDLILFSVVSVDSHLLSIHVLYDFFLVNSSFSLVFYSRVI